MADERRHRFRDVIDWARRGHWLWTVFPVGWKAYLVAAAVAGVAASLALLKSTPLPLLFIYSLAAVVIYAVGWAAVQRLAKDRKERDVDSSPGEVSLQGSAIVAPTLPERARQLAKELEAFINAHSDSRGPDVYKINFLYAAHFRDRVDKMLNELAAEQIFDVCEDGEINPQTQTARNIRSNIIDRLESLANRLEIKTSRMRRVKLIGSIEDARFGIHGTRITQGGVEHDVEVSVKLSVTNQEIADATVRRAKLMIETRDGKIFQGEIWEGLTPTSSDPRPLLMNKITHETPIRHAVATKGWLQFHVSGLDGTSSIEADVSVILSDEFDVPHTIRNGNLRIAA